MSEINFTERELAEIETLTLTKKIARSAKGALTAKQLAELLNISPKTIFKMAKAGRLPSFRIPDVRECWRRLYVLSLLLLVHSFIVADFLCALPLNDVHPAVLPCVSALLLGLMFKHIGLRCVPASSFRKARRNTSFQ